VGGSDIEMNDEVARYEIAGYSRVPQDRVQEGGRLC
jgi:hypothetical protein